MCLLFSFVFFRISSTIEYTLDEIFTRRIFTERPASLRSKTIASFIRVASRSCLIFTDTFHSQSSICHRQSKMRRTLASAKAVTKLWESIKPAVATSMHTPTPRCSPLCPHLDVQSSLGACPSPPIQHFPPRRRNRSHCCGQDGGLGSKSPQRPRLL